MITFCYVMLGISTTAYQTDHIKGQIFRDSYEAPKMRIFQKNPNGAQDGAQDRSYKRNTLSQKALKQRIYAVCAGRSDGT